VCARSPAGRCGARTGDNPCARDGKQAGFRRSGISIEPFTAEQAQIARQAYRDFGKGSHPAGLNFGDCLSYALAKSVDESLLFKGADFPRTDIESVV
jgi:ribonuclease VapC